MVITPECRYGHGQLEEMERIPAHHAWGYMGVFLTETAAGHPQGNPAITTSVSGGVFTVRLYRCSTCGYIEAFDDVVDHNG